jgi:hypothetical protein
VVAALKEKAFMIDSKLENAVCDALASIILLWACSSPTDSGVHISTVPDTFKNGRSALNSRVQQALLAKPQSEINPYSALGDAQIGGVREMQFPFDGVRRLDADENLIGGEKPKPSQGCVVVVKDSWGAWRKKR